MDGGLAGHARRRGGHQGRPRDVGRAKVDPRLARHTVEDASLAVEAGFRAEAPCSAMISKNGFENRNASYEIHIYSLRNQRSRFAKCEMAD